MKSKLISYEKKYEGDFPYVPLYKAWCKAQYYYFCPAIYFYKFLSKTNKLFWVEEEKFIPVRYYE